MALESIDAFIDELRKGKLLKAPQLDEVERVLKPRFSSSMLMAKDLVRRGWLTVYQVKGTDFAPVETGAYQAS